MEKMSLLLLIEISHLVSTMGLVHKLHRLLGVHMALVEFDSEHSLLHRSHPKEKQMSHFPAFIPISTTLWDKRSSVVNQRRPFDREIIKRTPAHMDGYGNILQTAVVSA